MAKKTDKNIMEKPRSKLNIKLSPGKPPIYKDTPKGLKDFETKAYEYINKSIDDGIYPTVMMLCVYLGISVDTFSEYRKRERYTDTIMRIKETIRGLKLHNALNNGNVSERMALFDLNVNEGMKDTLMEAKKMDAETNKERLDLDKEKFEHNKEQGISEAVIVNRVIDHDTNS